MYAKIFVQIYDGTLCTHGPWEALVTFQQFLILSDRNGIVDMTAAAISRRTTIPIGIINTGINALLRPDPESRTPDEDGRRLIPLSEGRDWGWKIVNYAHYRKIMREDDRREYHRNYWKKRKENNDHKAKLNTTQHAQLESTNQPIAYANAYANTDTEITASYYPVEILNIVDDKLVKKKEKRLKTVEKNNVPIMEIVGLYHKILHMLNRVCAITERRKSALNALWNKELNSIEHWERYFSIIEKSDFLTGKIVQNDRRFKADFDFIINKNNVVKIIEGRYENRFNSQSIDF